MLLDSNIDYYQNLQGDLASAFNRADRSAFFCKPRITFRLEKTFSDATILLAHTFLVNLFHLTGTRSYPVEIRGGCVDIEVLPETTTDMQGVDLRRQFLSDPSYFEFCERFEVSRIYFHGFPRVLEGTNREVVLHLDSAGHPITEESIEK
jgi:hypothetical protein